MASSAQQKLELPEDDEQREEEQQRLSICSDSAAAAAGGVDLKTNNNNNDDDDGSSLNINKPAARLPRWTRQEILVLIQGKKVAENRVRRGRSLATTAEPKWATVSSYCKRHGVNRGAVQCRKRWSNLAADFKKIKDWESSLLSRDNADADSFWVMRNDLRRDRKLPGFFDREVYDILDNKHDSPPPPPSPVLFDSGRTAPPHDPLFSDLTAGGGGGGGGGGGDEKQATAPNPEIGSPSSSRKRKRVLVEDDDIEEEGGSLSLLQIMEKNGRILSAQLEAHNVNLKLDREDRKDHSNSLVAVLNKLADALSRIADKL